MGNPAWGHGYHKGLSEGLSKGRIQGGAIGVLGGAGVGFIVGFICKKFFNIFKKQNGNKNIRSNYLGLVISIKKNRKDSNGYQYNMGEKYKIVEIENNVFKIKKLDDENDIRFISLDFLKTILN